MKLSAVAKLFLIFGLVLSYQGVTAGTKTVDGGSGTDSGNPPINNVPQK
jgi:hypothetical protein|tara:strand:- start:9 stop:155 length:147 start_codon:yes stop_codon:yes gene_type:complete